MSRVDELGGRSGILDRRQLHVEGHLELVPSVARWKQAHGRVDRDFAGVDRPAPGYRPERGFSKQAA